jgi:hypothetical protein
MARSVRRSRLHDRGVAGETGLGFMPATDRGVSGRHRLADARLADLSEQTAVWETPRGDARLGDETGDRPVRRPVWETVCLGVWRRCPETGLGDASGDRLSGV